VFWMQQDSLPNWEGIILYTYAPTKYLHYYFWTTFWLDFALLNNM
jgi:hypothetical protein